MMPSRFQSEELNIHHVGYPGNRMPVGLVYGCEGPSNSRYRNTILNLTVSGYVAVIVVINEIAMTYLPECYEGSNSQENANN